MLFLLPLLHLHHQLGPGVFAMHYRPSGQVGERSPAGLTKPNTLAPLHRRTPATLQLGRQEGARRDSESCGCSRPFTSHENQKRRGRK